MVLGFQLFKLPLKPSALRFLQRNNELVSSSTSFHRHPPHFQLNSPPLYHSIHQLNQCFTAASISSAPLWVSALPCRKISFSLLHRPPFVMCHQHYVAGSDEAGGEDGGAKNSQRVKRSLSKNRVLLLRVHIFFSSQQGFTSTRSNVSKLFR